MHEYGIAYDIYATARRTAEDHHARAVKRVMIDVGDLAMVNPEQVEFLFHAIAAEDPLFSGTSLCYRKVTPRTRCRCGYEGEEVFVCPRCGGLPELTQGREIVVTNLEIDVEGP